jgi:hypothetical protein
MHEKRAVWDGAKMLTGEREAITTRPVEASRARGIRTPHRLPKGYLLLITVYSVIIGLFMFFHGGFIGPDTFLVFVALAALILGQS